MLIIGRDKKEKISFLCFLFFVFFFSTVYCDDLFGYLAPARGRQQQQQLSLACCSRVVGRRLET